MDILIENIITKFNPRSKVTADKTLVDSIKEVGIIQPITVVENGEGAYILVDGGRRLAACKKLNLKVVDAVIKEYDEHDQKKVAVITDLTKDLLPLGDKAVAIANLVDKEKKYTSVQIAKFLNMKKSDVTRLISIARAEKKVIQLLNEGMIDASDAVDVARIGNPEVQVKVAETMAKDQVMFRYALERHAYELPFDDTFTYQQAKADRQVGIVVKDWNGESVFTFDKEYYKQKRDEFEAREKRSYEEAVKKGNKAAARNDQSNGKKEKPKDYKKARDEQAKILDTYRDVIERFLVKDPDTVAIQALIHRYARQLSVDD
jgi:ParB/RepB/Spo0J family partition protein